ncbi:MAG: MBL fold metallo-hydrolase [Myxococcaceae bacterium]|jgi:phosphoribosyl 1,2-cyclic phosphodiesterase|nr:MBL fold metallo-hydrolase [Myxococcaceae bacterium]
MEVRFWGVRGSVASSGSHVARIGGNTSCLEVESHGHRLILDAGTGLRQLGETLLPKQPIAATMLFSHLHWDHVQGFPFFTPAYLPSSQFVLYGPGADGEQQLRSVLARQMEPPNFPVPLSAMRAQLDFRSARPGAIIETGPFRITPVELPHPQGCIGYHIEADGRRFAYCTDVELTLEALDGRLGRILEGVDALVLDAQYTPDEYEGRVGPPKKGWGHSTMIEAARIAKATDAQRLFLFHHDPAHSDDQVETMAEAAKQVFPLAEPAREGKHITL